MSKNLNGIQEYGETCFQLFVYGLLSKTASVRRKPNLYWHSHCVPTKSHQLLSANNSNAKGMAMKYMNKSLMVAVTLLLITASALAQTSRGAVSGIVSDQTGVSRTTTTNGEGVYRFDAVDPGSYSVKIAATGFGALNKTNIVVSANQVAQIDAQLAPGAQTLSVDVTAESGALLQTEAPVRGGNIETQRITELPFAGRNPVALALTIPGVSTNRNGFGVGTFSVNGGRGRSNNFLIDGTENNDISVAGQGFQITNPDAVQEVSVQTSNYDAEFGRAGGAVVNTITKSGTNKFHG
jgi:hypothetical protein